VGTGACGICCDVCRLKLRGLCSSCGAGTGPAGREKLRAQEPIFHGACPVLSCARDSGIGTCPRDGRFFPCPVFEQGPYPFSEGFLRVQKRRRQANRPPSLDLDGMLRWEREEIFPGFWEELTALHPPEVCARSGAAYAQAGSFYSLRVLGRDYRVVPRERRVLEGTAAGVSHHRHGRVSFTEALILVVYLLKARDIPLAGKRVTAKELPGGALFFRGPHELLREPVLSRYGRDPRAFLRAGRALGGEPVSLGDAGIRLPVLPRIPLECVLWAGDDEFPPSLTYIFDASVAGHLPLDVVWALAALVANRLLEKSA